MSWRKAEAADLLNLWIIRTARINGTSVILTLLPAGNKNFSGGKMVCVSSDRYPADRLQQTSNYAVTCGNDLFPARVDQTDNSVWIETTPA